MKQQLAWSWYAYGVSWKNLLHTSMNSHDNFFSVSILNLVADLKKRILSGITPIIIFNAQGETIGHSAQVHEVHTENLKDGRINYRLVLDDSNNQPAESGEFNQKNSLYLKQGDDNFYDLLDEEENKLGRLEIIDSSDPFYERIIFPLSNFCRKQTHCLEK